MIDPEWAKRFGEFRSGRERFGESGEGLLHQGREDWLDQATGV